MLYAPWFKRQTGATLYVTLCMGQGKHVSTGQAPFFLMFSRHPRLPVDVAMVVVPTTTQIDVRKTGAKYIAQL